MAVPGATDWDDYYRRPGTGTRFSRFWVGRRLLDTIRFALGAAGVLGPLSVVEYGGANSCFLPSILASLAVRRYTIVDTNPLGLMLTRQRWAGHTVVEAREGDVLAELPEDLRADLVFSVGLIEHFDAAGTARALHTHLQATRPGGVCLLSYPTPTLLYRVARRIAELTGQWRFHDERPLRLEEIKPTVDAYGSLITTHLIWPIIFTQQMIAIVRRSPAGASPNDPIPGVTRTIKSQTAVRPKRTCCEAPLNLLSFSARPRWAAHYRIAGADRVLSHKKSGIQKVGGMR